MDMDMSANTVQTDIPRRSQNACDACRARKVKCRSSDGSVCKMCQELQIPCTHNTPRKRRGPLNRYVLAESQSQVSFSESVSPDSRLAYGIERLAPLSTIEQIIHDWFELIHSVCPVFHRGIFLNRLASSEPLQDGIFAALVISVCAATVASLKRKSFKDYDNLTAERCLKAVEEIELHIGKQPISLEWCQMKYHLSVALSTERSMDDPDSFRLCAESTAGVKYLTFYEMPLMPRAPQQLLKRLFWLLFAAGYTADLHSRPHMSLLTPQDNINALTPLELSDNELDSTQAIVHDPHWHGRTKSYVPGLNYLSKLFLIWHSSQQVANKTMEQLKNDMELVRCALNYLPPDLNWRGGLSKPSQSNFGTEVQTANLYITQLHIRSNLLEQMNTISKSSGITQTPPEIINERQMIVEDMLEILYHMPQEAIEANGYSILPKIRDVGSALLDEVRTGDRSEPMSPKGSANLERLLAKLESLDVQSQLQYLEKGLLSV